MAIVLFEVIVAFDQIAWARDLHLACCFAVAAAVLDSSVAAMVVAPAYAGIVNRGVRQRPGKALGKRSILVLVLVFVMFRVGFWPKLPPGPH